MNTPETPSAIDASTPAPPATAVQAASATPVASAQAMQGGKPDVSAVRRLWRVFRAEPMLLVTFGYVFVSIIGLLDSYLFYRRFGVPILEFMQSSDYFVAGLRRPAYLAMLAWAMLASVLALLPEYWRRRNPARAQRLDRTWWGRTLLPRRSDWWVYFGIHPETITTLAAVTAVALGLISYSTGRANAIYAGQGDRVEVRQMADARLVAGDWRMLGTSSAFVMLWDPQAKRVEVLPIDSISRITPMGRVSAAEVSAQAVPASAASPQAMP